MDQLTSKQRAHLRSLAHHLKPIVHIGVGGLTEAALASIVDAFKTRELLKVKVLEAAPRSARDSADVAQTIGRTVVLYHRHPEKPEIRLPGS